jgi:hypothetical protein
MTWMISFVKGHPVVGGVLCAIFGAFLIHVSIEDARRYRLFENADTVTGQVLSITQASQIPPRFDIVVSRPTGSGSAQTVLRTGPRAAEELKAGDALELLVRRVNGEIMLASQRPEDSPVRLAGFEATPVVFFGIGIALFGIFLAIFGERLLQNA